ncbi:MAG: vWA domain-containing protein [Myxococcota bacterium]
MIEIGRRIGVLAVASFVSLGLAACNDHPLKEVKLESEIVNQGTVAVVQRKDVDVLFVIDNSGSMGEEQATLAGNFESFIAKLEQPGVEANYRIAVTTTDSNHAHCAGGENGRFQMSSCRSRTQDFQRGGTSGPEDNFFDESCAAVCDLDVVETTPTTTLVDSTPKSRPWIESIGGVTNLPDGVTPAQAFQCVGPQGVAGCGYESPLESMRQALTRTSVDTEPSHGFVRPGAILAVVFVTDEADCSANYKDVPDPWDPNGEQFFWSEDNKSGGYPQSEVCWYAGVTCEDNGDGTKTCVPANKDELGQPADDDTAVMHPVSRYSDFLQKIEDEKRALDADAGLESSDVLVAVIGGVPPGYVKGQEIPYRDGTVGEDVAFQEDNGIAPGCRTEGIGEAVPPVRMRDFAAAFATDGSDKTNLFSVCQADYTPALQEIADLIETQIRPACVPVCVEDSDPSTVSIVEHNCVVTEEVGVAGGTPTETTVPACRIDGDKAEVPDGSDVCYLSLSDADKATESTLDDMDSDCVDEGWNLELKIVRRDGVREVPGSSISANCSASPRASLDCPNL